ncbi:FAD-dependent oxidoreductase [Polymorphobacter glacialis]|uniref:FAD-dependent oxidoreductase n=1 Tax=Sandarakinorhabdus glacialis TaxID=1614636 RepID=A0A916ZZ82_9SPHN|nr:FAD-dependent monooxygenase [Polymorphobacter glacialis]GGE20025.1 FAD-dependent oxidoreductase [Polymorphobacter glacialis]
MMQPVIIGGGLAGGSVATRLAQLGHAPVLLEREPGAHDKICGEFLSVEASRHLAAIGFDVARLGGARIDTMRLHVGGRTAEARLPFVATGITRRSLDAALLDHAAAAGAEIRRGISVRHIDEGRVVTAEGEIGRGPVILATGKHELRGEARDPAGTIADLIGFKQFFRTTPALSRALAGAVTVTAFDGGYAGLQCVEGGRLNLCLLVDRARFKGAGSWEALFAALVREPGLALLADAEPLLPRPLTIAAVPYGYLATPAAGDPIWRLGDQAAVIPSFCGDGMAMALHGGRLAADMLAAGAAPHHFQARLRRDVSRQVRLAIAVQRFAGTRAGRFALVAGLAAVPAALSALARWTRVETSAVARAGA